MITVQLTESQFQLVCIAIEDSREDFNKYGEDSVHVEDAVEEWRTRKELEELQKIFPARTLDDTAESFEELIGNVVVHRGGNSDDTLEVMRLLYEANVLDLSVEERSWLIGFLQTEIDEVDPALQPVELRSGLEKLVTALKRG
jgi:hypothetical protein